MTDKQKFNFTKAIKELEEVNSWFQSGDINLEEGLTKFRRGLELIKSCRKRLKEAENEFTEMKKGFAAEEKQAGKSKMPF